MIAKIMLEVPLMAESHSGDKVDLKTDDLRPINSFYRVFMRSCKFLEMFEMQNLKTVL